MMIHIYVAHPLIDVCLGAAQHGLVDLGGEICDNATWHLFPNQRFQ
jgi:hypothetical protein